MDLYRLPTRLLRLLPPELAHRLALSLLQVPLPAGGPMYDPFDWKGTRFPNRVGVAAGLDKNGTAVAGLGRIGAGFAEVGTILVAPWQGLRQRPRLLRVSHLEGIWNRLGVPSSGVAQVLRNLSRFRRPARRGFVVACNIGLHPGNLARARNASESLEIARGELLQLAESLFEPADGFVVNLSSPNTPGLRSLFEHEALAPDLLVPVRRLLVRLDRAAGRQKPTFLLVKVPPEDASRRPWDQASLARVISPLVSEDACDGFVAVNTSARLALEHVSCATPEYPGGISGAPLHSLAIEVVGLLRAIVGPGRLIVGLGGILEPRHANDLVRAGADLVEMYSGLIYRGPGLIRACVEELRRQRGAASV